MKSADAVRLFKSRDSATSVLRKLGIKPRDYNFFIEVTSDGMHACHVARAEAHLKSLFEPAKPTRKEVLVGGLDQLIGKPEQKERKKGVQPPLVIVNKGIGDVCKTMILAGKSNKEIWGVVKEQFNLDDKKKGYPAWYRCQLRRQGKVD